MKFSILFVQISALASVCLVRFREENGEIIDVYVKFVKVRMDYSCHGRYKGIHIVFVCFHCSVLRISPGQVENYQLFVSFAGLRSQYSKRYKHAGTSSIFF